MTAGRVTRRRAGLMLLAQPAALAAGAALANPAPKTKLSPGLPGDMALGDPRAKVTVVEYASVACPVCGRWQRDVFPAFKAKYIDTRRVRFVTREMLVGDEGEVAAAAAGFMLARCVDKARYFEVTDAIYRDQPALFADPKAALLKIATGLGLSEARFDACVRDPAALRALNTRVDVNARSDNVHATPTFVINGQSMEAGYHTLEELDAAIANAPRRP